jgi:hypothetical protein
LLLRRGYTQDIVETLLGDQPREIETERKIKTERKNRADDW